MPKNKPDAIVVDIYIGNDDKDSIEIFNGSGGIFIFKDGLRDLTSDEIDDIAVRFAIELRRLINSTGEEDDNSRRYRKERKAEEIYANEDGIKLPNSPTSFKKH